MCARTSPRRRDTLKSLHQNCNILNGNAVLCNITQQMWNKKIKKLEHNDVYKSLQPLNHPNKSLSKTYKVPHVALKQNTSLSTPRTQVLKYLFWNMPCSLHELWSRCWHCSQGSGMFLQHRRLGILLSTASCVYRWLVDGWLRFLWSQLSFQCL